MSDYHDHSDDELDQLLETTDDGNELCAVVEEITRRCQTPERTWGAFTVIQMAADLGKYLEEEGLRWPDE